MEQTLAIFKPDCLEKALLGKVLDKILTAGFQIKAMKMIKLTRKETESFYEIHRGKPFFTKLVEFMTEGPVVVAVLEKENAVADWRALMGKTDPHEAAEGTIRHLWAETVSRNVVHGSDSIENAQHEISFFFSQVELL
ncbi:MAG: nucleoside-diphosphate kinase [candidate division KSB1 bacterium]|nr:nucleoside-diphosphate kinase [candidate division KSB1 bacterium]MDZ7346918.1 nucleoside-diphosphate kinase [candidate division KSB1 bacterium]MDZ7369925.1 nucleoside-diphosphate kinase [candidate division KSB1 bacterium]